MTTTTVPEYYTKYRAEGVPAAYAWSRAKHSVEYDRRKAEVTARWNDAEAAGLVRLEIKPDEFSSPDDLFGDTYDPKCHPDIPARQIEAERKAEIERINHDGVWGIIGEYRCCACNSWNHADSVWGFIGEDWKDSGYDLDVMEQTLDALNKQRATV